MANDTSINGNVQGENDQAQGTQEQAGTAHKPSGQQMLNYAIKALERAEKGQTAGYLDFGVWAYKYSCWYVQSNTGTWDNAAEVLRGKALETLGIKIKVPELIQVAAAVERLCNATERQIAEAHPVPFSTLRILSPLVSQDVNRAWALIPHVANIESESDSALKLWTDLLDSFQQTGARMTGDATRERVEKLRKLSLTTGAEKAKETAKLIREEIPADAKPEERKAAESRAAKAEENAAEMTAKAEAIGVKKAPAENKGPGDNGNGSVDGTLKAVAATNVSAGTHAATLVKLAPNAGEAVREMILALPLTHEVLATLASAIAEALTREGKFKELEAFAVALDDAREEAKEDSCMRDRYRQINAIRKEVKEAFDALNGK